MKLAHNLSNPAAYLLFFLAGVAGLAFTGARAFGQSQTGFTYNGVAYTSYWYNEYLETPQGPDGTAAMAAYGVNYATVLATQYQQTYTSTSIAPSSTQTPTDAAVVAAITNLQNAGIKVALKPQVDSYDGYWRGQFEPTDPTAWFSSYQTFIVHYATIAQAQSADLFVIGCEFATLSGSAYQSNWETIISAVRAVYSGPITYAANATGAGDEFTRVSFWDKLDLIGVDGYFPLTNQADPTLTQLENAWTIAADNKNGFAPVTALHNLQLAYPSLPLIFTEIGYTSTAGTNEAPYNYTPTAAYDPTEQASCFEAFFQVFSQESSWVKGVFWWGWSVSPPGTDDTGYSPQNKPAADVLAQWYGGEYFTLTPSPAALSVTQGNSANDTITATNGNGFAGSVTLSVSGLPSGVTEAVVLAPTVPGQTVLSFTASSTAAAGTFRVTITGASASGTLTTFTTIALTVSAPRQGFTLGASPSTLPVTQGSGGTSTITVTDVGGFTGDVTLSATGLPAGVTAAFATNPATSTSVLTLTASGTAATGTATVTITGSVPSVCGLPCQIPSASTTIGLTVNPAPSFTLSASPATVTILLGIITGTSSSTITVTYMGGFIGAPTLAASGLPDGVTASFGTNPTNGSSTLTLVASATATLGQATVTITGTAPQCPAVSCPLISATTAIALTVNSAPSFTLSASPSTLPVSQGASATSNILVAAANGFNEPVTLSASGLPAGVTAAFATNPATSTSVLTLTASSTAATGPATVTILGSAPTQVGVSCGLPCNLTASTTIALTVNPPPGFTLSTSPSSLTVTAGNGGTSTITVTPSGGFTGSVTLMAGFTSSPSGVVNPPALSFGSTSPVSITGATAGQATLTVSTSVPGGCGSASLQHRGVSLYTAGGAALASILLFGIPARRCSWRKLLGLAGLFIVLAGGMTACGGNGGSATCNAFTLGTTTGAYTVNVIATSGTITATVPINLNVQ
ncbi:MAG: hypothetical protein ABSC48_19500 [Terracidiphilus sp.]